MATVPEDVLEFASQHSLSQDLLMAPKPKVRRAFILCFTLIFVPILGIAEGLKYLLFAFNLCFGGMRRGSTGFSSCLSYSVYSLFLSTGLLQLSHPLKGQKGLPQVGVLLVLLPT